MNTIFSQKRWQGIADYPKENANGQIQNAYYFGRAINYRNDPQSITLLPASLKESGGTVTDLLKWGDLVPLSLISYFYGDSGNIYSRSMAGSWSNLHTTSGSHGNGLAYFSGDDYVYYTTDTDFGRYGPTQNSPTFTDSYLRAQGGVPQNTNSLLLASASTMYAHAADSTSLSITGDLTLETYFKANTLPTVGNSMTLLGKWDESGAKRSYKLDLFGVSGYFGSGTDGSLVISSNTTEALIDSACTGTATTQSLSATNVSFAVNQVIMIHQSQGTNAGQWERNTIQGYTAGTITLGTPLLGTYTSGAQVRVLKQYTNVTVNTGITYTAKAWNGTTGGILAFLANGTTTKTGSITAVACGFRGGLSGHNSQSGSDKIGQQGESQVGTGALFTTSYNAASGGGGGGGGGAVGDTGSGGGGGSNATAGANGYTQKAHPVGQGALGTYGSSDLTTALFGGGGGGGGFGDATPVSGSFGNGKIGGGFIFITTVDLTGSGTITANGQATEANADNDQASGGAGAGGSILLKVQTATLGTGLITASGGAGGSSLGYSGGAGGDGRITIDYLTSYTGSTTPTITAIQDNTLVTTTTIQARLGISNDGTANEFLTYNLNNLTTGTWNRLSVVWNHSTSTAAFYLNAVLLGTSTGTKTAISDNTSLFYVGADQGASSLQNYFNGYLDDMRVWSNRQSSPSIFANLNTQINPASTGLAAYYKFNNAYTDATSNTNTLTAVNTPTFSSDVPFSDATTRLDIDRQNTNVGQTYTLLTSISEASTDMLTFTPVTDPQASIGFYVDTKGTGDWTVTIHDAQNRVIATKTILAANIPSSGFIEFIFATPWRLLLNKTYHAHLTVSTGTSKVVTGSVSDFSTAEFATYFGWLVTDTQFHPIVQFQYQPLGGVLTGAIIIGNERYLAVWDGTNYLPNFITFPPAWRVRCFGFWKEYLAVGMWRGGNIYDFDRGRIYFWDGIAPTFNFFIDVPDGQINAMFGVDNDLYIFAGYRGELIDYQGGYFSTTGNSQSQKLKRMPLIQETDYTDVFPGAVAMWRGLLHFGLFGNSNSTIMQRGVYSYGTLNQYYPNTLSYDYELSTGNNGSTVTIGCVFPVGQNLIVGWKDGISYGADKINFSNPPASSGELQVLIQDDGAIWKDKANLAVRADFLPLAAGESVDTKISIDRSSFAVSTVQSTLSSTFNKQPVSNGRGREYQVGVDLYASGSTSPTLVGLSLLKEKLDSEAQF